MPNQEAIRQELEATIASAEVGEETHRQYMMAKFENRRPITDTDIITHVTTQTEALIARWAKVGLAHTGNTPEDALRFVHNEATAEMFKGTKRDTELGRAMQDRRKAILRQFIELTNYLFTEE